MSIKFQYRGVNKKIVISSISSFSMLFEKVMKAFNTLPQDVKFFFMQNEEKIWINDEASLQKLKMSKAGCKVFIIEDGYSDIIEESNVSIITEVLENEPPIQPIIIKQPEILEKNTIKKQPEIVKETEATKPPEIIKKPDVIKNPQAIKQPQIKKRKTVGPETMKSINFLEVIYNIFGRDMAQVDKDNQIRPWIKLDNLVVDDPVTASQVWRASEHLVKKICQDNQ